MAKASAKHVNAQRQLARQLVSSLDLVDIRLIHCACSQMLRNGELPDKLETSIESEGKFVGEQSKVIMFHNIATVGSYTSGKPAEHSPLSVSAVFRSEYKIWGKLDITERRLEAFGRTISVVHTWPYWREFLQSTTTRMGLPPLTVPIFRMPAIGKKPAASRPKRPRRKRKSS